MTEFVREQNEKNLQDFLAKKDSKSYRKIEAGLNQLCAYILHRRYGHVDKFLKEEILSVLNEHLLNKSKFESGAMKFAYGFIEKEILNQYRVNSKIVFPDDLTRYDIRDDNENEFEEMQIKVVSKLNSLRADGQLNRILEAITECIQKEDQYNNFVLTLYIIRKTRFCENTIKKRIRKELNLGIKLSDRRTIEDCFTTYIRQHGKQISTGKIVEDWEKKAGDYFMEQRKSETYEHRHFAVGKTRAEKNRRSVQSQRLQWLMKHSSLATAQRFVEYNKVFALTITTYKKDQHRLRELSNV